MGKVSLLDCTLRDGGYLNNWLFGRNAIQTIEKKLVDAGIEIVEVGFLKKEPYNPDRTVFSREEQIESIIHPKKQGTLYAGMVEVVNPLPIEDLIERSATSLDVIRVIVWKRLLREGFNYCREIAARGYRICIQPARVSQYSEQEFIEMIELFNTIKPMALYVVDSWGTQVKNEILRYVDVAHQHLDPDIALGYHGHNNLQQAFSCGEALVDAKLDRDIIIDASVFGMGRGAGNLNLELFAAHLNENHGKSYDLGPIFEIYSEYIDPIFRKTQWGYSVPHFLTAKFDCNPEYATYLSQEQKLSTARISKVLASLSDVDRVMFSPETAQKYLGESTTHKVGNVNE